MTKTADIQSDWVEWLMRKEGVKISRLSTGAGLAASTLARKDKTEFNGYSASIIDAVKQAYDVPAPDVWHLGVGKDDASPAEAEKEPPFVFDFAENAPNAETWRVNTKSCALLGYMPGDFIIIDPDAEPAQGDIVLAKLYDIEKGEPKIVMRAWSPFFLAPASVDDPADGILVNGAGNLTIIGPVLASWRLTLKR